MKEFVVEKTLFPHEDYFKRIELRSELEDYLHQNAKRFECPYGFILQEDIRAGNSFYRAGTVICMIKGEGILENLDCEWGPNGIFEGQDFRNCSWLGHIPKDTLEKVIQKYKKDI